MVAVMYDAFSKMTAILLGVVLTLVLPLQYARSRLVTMEDMYVLEGSVELVDSIRNTGQVTRDMYVSYMGRLQTLPDRYVAEVDRTAPVIVNGQVEKSYYDSSDIEVVIYGGESAYGFRKGDYIRIRVKRVSNGGAEWLVCSYGGYVNNEIY
jgi:hypothetical protein